MIYTAVNVTKDQVSVPSSTAKGIAMDRPNQDSFPLLWYWEGHSMPFRAGVGFPFRVLLLSSQILQGERGKFSVSAELHFLRVLLVVCLIHEHRHGLGL